MTRINCIPVEDLTDKHLLAEYRELPRVFKLARPDANIPPTYRLGTGHVTFFYNKLGYLQRRQSQIIRECQKRGFNIQYTNPYWNVPEELGNDWTPTPEAMALNRARIADRLMGAK